MKIKRILLFLVAILCVIQFSFCLKVDAATSEPNWNGGCYSAGNNIFASSGYYGQCTWYAWGRALEVAGVRLDACTGPASNWYDQARSAGYTISSTPRANSIACWKYSEGYGHVAFVESVSGNDITITEANYRNNRWDWMDFNTGVGNYDGRSTINPYSRNGFQGYIYVGGNPDPTPPTIQDAYVSIYDMQTTCFRVEAKVTDNVGVTSVRFPTWTNNNGQDDIIWHDGVYNTTKGVWEYVVNTKDHKNETGLYTVHVYAYDAAGNASSAGINNIVIGKTPANLGDYTARIVAKADSNKVVGISGRTSKSNVVIQNKNTSDSTQLWKFVRDASGNFYRIQNVSTGLWLHLTQASDNNGAEFLIYDKRENDAQRFFIMSYNGGYRIVPKCSKNMKAFDFAGGSNYTVGSKTLLWEAQSTTHNLQTVKFEKVDTTWNNPFKDVSTANIFYEDIKYVYKNKYMVGYNSQKFAPNEPLTRGQFVAILYRIDGQKSVDYTVKFKDIKPTTKHYEAIKWAAKNGIISGYTTGENKGKFMPNNKITRQQFAAMLQRYAKYKGKNVTSTKSLVLYDDYKTIANYAKEPMQWAVDKGIITGKRVKLFRKSLLPEGDVTRATAAAMIHRYCENV